MQNTEQKEEVMDENYKNYIEEIVASLKKLIDQIEDMSEYELDELLDGKELAINKLIDSWEDKEDKEHLYEAISMVFKFQKRPIR